MRSLSLQPKFVLSLDGGGSHLLIQLSVLASLENETGISVYDLFDMVAGSSSGGMTACLILGRTTSASEIVQMIQQDKLLENMMTGHWMNRLLNRLHMRPKYSGVSKSRVLQRELGYLRLASLDKQIFVPCFNLDRDQLEIVTNSCPVNFLLSEIADACTAAPAYFPPVQMEDGGWRIDGGVGMNNPALGAYLHALKIWPDHDVKVLSIGSGWRSFAFNGSSACAYGGMQWSVKGIASVILREKMMANARMTEAMLGRHVLYINDHLKNYGMPDHMDSANHPEYQHKSLEIGRLWYERNRDRIKKWLSGQPEESMNIA
ncbi:MAG: patatin-like phospholipase family protein [Nitrosomonas sp.]|nr:patatin-like phospholipase family protein [Nitrosomonas sp.]